MSNDQFSSSGNAAIKPIDAPAFFTGVPIVEGAETTQNTYRGTKDLAYNNNTLYGQLSRGFQLLFNQRPSTNSGTTRTNSTGVSTTSTSYETLLEYRYQPMRLRQRSKIDFYILPFVKSGTTATFKVTTGSDTSGQTVTFSDAESATWKFASIDISTTGTDYVRLEGKVAGSSPNTVIAAINVLQQPLPVGTALTQVEQSGGESVFIPADITQYGADLPMSVKGLRELKVSSEHLYADSTRQIVQYCFPRNLDYTDAATIRGNPLRTYVWCQDASAFQFPYNDPRICTSFFYKRRPGNSKLLAYINGYTENWASGRDSTFIFRVRPVGSVKAEETSFAMAQTYASVAWGSTWHINGEEVAIPEGVGELMQIDVLAKPGRVSTTDYPGHILALSLIEKRLK